MLIEVEVKAKENEKHFLTINEGFLLFDNMPIGQEVRVISLQKGLIPEIKYQANEKAEVVDFNDFSVEKVSIFEN